MGKPPFPRPAWGTWGWSAFTMEGGRAVATVWTWGDVWMRWKPVGAEVWELHRTYGVEPPW